MQASEKKIKKPAKIKKGAAGKSASTYWLWMVLALILALTYFSYQPAMKAKFTNWDDDKYVTENPVIKNISGDNFKKIVTGYFEGNYHPLTMLSLAWNYSTGKLNPAGYHRTNIVLHLLNTALVFWLIFLLLKNLPMTAIAAALFGIHTMHVESVAWISERKDVLYAFFFLLSLISYIHYLEKGRLLLYMASLILFLLSLLSKGMAVSLVLSLFIVDFYYDRKLKERKAILDKIPFLILAILFGYIAIKAQQIQSLTLANDMIFPFFQRIVFAGYALISYLGKLVYPYHLAIFYPYPIKPGEALPVIYFIFLLLSLGITGLFIYSLKFSKKYFFGYAFFVLNIILVLQVISVGKAIMADRYTYVSSIGIFFIAASAYQLVRQSWRNVAVGLFVIYSMILVYQTRERCLVWQNSLALWNDQIVKYPQHIDAYKNRGLERGQNNDYKGALADFNKVIELDPNYASAYTDRGMARQLTSDTLGALNDYSKAISIDEKLVLAYYNRANLKLAMNNNKNALDDFNAALKLNPDDPNMLYDRGRAWLNLNDIDNAQNDFDRAIQLDPSFSLAYSNRGLIKMNQKDNDGAMADFNSAIQFNPKLAIAYYNRGVLKFNLNNRTDACSDFKTALENGHAEAAGLINLFYK